MQMLPAGFDLNAAIDSVLFTLLPLLGLLAIMRQVLHARRSERWSSTYGLIIKVAVDRRTLAPSVVTYGPEISYAYEVDGKSYVGRRLAVADPVYTGNPDDAEKMLGTFREGQRVTVYYDPRHPRQAVLIPGLAVSHQELLFGTSVCTFLLFFGVILVVSQLRTLA